MSHPVYGNHQHMDMLRPGQNFGPYRIGECLGSGAVAVVYSARSQDGRAVALKILNPVAARQPHLRQVLRNEYRILARLNHAGIVNVHDAGQIDSHPFIALSLLEGQTLDHLLQQQERLGETASISIAIQVADVVDYLHRQEIVHRDVKPGNIFLTRSRRAVLFDFGTAYDPALPRSPTGDQAEEEGIYGTPAFLAPEQIRKQEAVDGRADLYALGIILYRMISGRKPFYGSRTEVLDSHLHQPPPRPSEFAYISPAVEEIVLKAIAKDPVHRFQTGAAFSRALTNAHVEEPPQKPSLPRRILGWIQRE